MEEQLPQFNTEELRNDLNEVLENKLKPIFVEHDVMACDIRLLQRHKYFYFIFKPKKVKESYEISKLKILYEQVEDFTYCHLMPVAKKHHVVEGIEIYLNSDGTFNTPLNYMYFSRSIWI